MISSIIKEGIHKIIRKNNLSNMIIWFAYPKSSFLEEYIQKVKKLLRKDMVFNSGTPKKYILYVQYIREEFKDLNENDVDDIIVSLFNLYDIPKKRNNFYIIFLLYYLYK